MRNALLLIWLQVAIGGFVLMLGAHLRTDRAQEASR